MDESDYESWSGEDEPDYEDDDGALPDIDTTDDESVKRKRRDEPVEDAPATKKKKFVHRKLDSRGNDVTHKGDESDSDEDSEDPLVDVCLPVRMKQTTPVVKHLRIIQEVDSEIDESDIALINEDVSDSETVYVGEPDRKDESDADTVIIEDDDSKTPANPPPTLTPRAPLRRVSRRRLPFTKLWKKREL